MNFALAQQQLSFLSFFIDLKLNYFWHCMEKSDDCCDDLIWDSLYKTTAVGEILGQTNCFISLFLRGTFMCLREQLMSSRNGRITIYSEKKM